VTAARQLTATARFDGRWWLVSVPELDVVGQARAIRDVAPAAAEVAALHLNVPREDVDVHVTVHVSEEAERLREEAQQLEDEASAVQQRAAQLRREAVRRSRTDGYKLDTVAAAFRVTPGRIQQLAATPGAP
jgi:hypothetical protein